MSKTRGIKDFNRSKFNSPSSDDCQCIDTSKLSNRINTRECRSRRNVDVERVKRSPSRIEKKYTRRETSASPDGQVTSVDVIKSWSRDRPRSRKYGDESVRDTSSNRSSTSSILPPRFHSTKIPENPQKPKSQPRKSDEISCSCCECTHRLQTERLKLSKDSRRLEKSQGTLTPHASTFCPPGSSTKTQKLCSMLKTREAKRIIGCTCMNDWNANCSIDCRCPETPADITTKPSKKSTNSNINIDDNSPSEDACSCRETSPDEYPSSPINLQDLQPTVAPINDWKKCGQYLKKFSNEYRILSSHLRSIRREIDAVKNPGGSYRKRITRKYPDKEFSFEVRSTGQDSPDKNCWKGKTVDRSCQCPNSPEVSRSTADRFRRSEVPRIDQKGRGQGQKKSPDPRCNTSLCNCRPKPRTDDFDKIESLQNFGSKRRQKRGVRRHDFSLPRIASVKKEGVSKDDRMMIYPPKNETGCPLALYKKGSYVNCSVEQVDDVGFKYDVAYVQRYVSLPWRPGEYSEHDVKSDYLSTDDYG